MTELNMNSLEKVNGGIAIATLYLIGWGGAILAGWATGAKASRR